jgi:hypothetical protein
MPTDTAAPHGLTEPLYVAWNAVPHLLASSRAHLARMRAAGKFGPEVIRWGRKLLVRRSELIAWAESGMPDAATWRAMQATRRRLPVRA